MVELTTQRQLTDMHTLFRDFRGQLSWGRVCALVGLIVAVVGQFKTHEGVPLLDADHLKIWLGLSFGNYGASKVTEMFCGQTIASDASTGCVGTTLRAGGNHET